MLTTQSERNIQAGIKKHYLIKSSPTKRADVQGLLVCGGLGHDELFEDYHRTNASADWDGYVYGRAASFNM